MHTPPSHLEVHGGLVGVLLQLREGPVRLALKEAEEVALQLVLVARHALLSLVGLRLRGQGGARWKGWGGPADRGGAGGVGRSTGRVGRTGAVLLLLLFSCMRACMSASRCCVHPGMEQTCARCPAPVSAKQAARPPPPHLALYAHRRHDAALPRHGGLRDELHRARLGGGRLVALPRQLAVLRVDHHCQRGGWVVV